MGPNYVPNTQSVTGSWRLEMKTPALLRLYCNERAHVLAPCGRVCDHDHLVILDLERLPRDACFVGRPVMSMVM